MVPRRALSHLVLGSMQIYLKYKETTNKAIFTNVTLFEINKRRGMGMGVGEMGWVREKVYGGNFLI
jgi:hypothetical protein